MFQVLTTFRIDQDSLFYGFETAADGFVTFRGNLYNLSAINLVNSGWQHFFTQSYSPITFQADFFIRKVFKVCQSFLWKDACGSCMLNSFFFVNASLLPAISLIPSGLNYP